MLNADPCFACFYLPTGVCNELHHCNNTQNIFFSQIQPCNTSGLLPCVSNIAAPVNNQTVVATWRIRDKISSLTQKNLYSNNMCRPINPHCVGLVDLWKPLWKGLQWYPSCCQVPPHIMPQPAPAITSRRRSNYHGGAFKAAKKPRTA